ncbi:MAG TPA: metallophosphoesterase [Rhodothermales bacterium]|nr:metallophosphoesterase [Rhodothermales bacterium]
MKRLPRALCAFLALLLTALSAPAPDPEPFFFIQLSDPQLGMFAADSNFIQETANFEFAIATANRLHPAFVIVTGDLVNKPGDPAQIAEYKRIAAELDPSIPLYDVAGNHDVSNVPTPESIAAYTKAFGPDHYTFRKDGFVGIVLNSSLIHSPEKAPEQYAAQERWLREELEKARREGARHIVVFAHHPWFLKAPDEPDQYFNIPSERRAHYLDLFRQYGVRYLFSGHLHQNALAQGDGLEAVTTGPVGKPLGDARSGIRVVMVTDTAITHQYYPLGNLPHRIEVAEF